MKLLIRSQSKLSLVEAEDLNAIEIEGKWHIVKLNVLLDLEHRIELGIYATKERALEVLDEIQNLLNPMLVFKNCETDNDTLKAIKKIGACMVNNNSHIEQIQTCIYEMPKV